jgi:hypothetical protein
MPSDGASRHGPMDEGKRPRPVLVIVTEWPSGTMAVKFGHAMTKALQVSLEKMQVIQMGPERIFRAKTEVSETEFRDAMAKSDVSCPGRVLFVEL